MIIGKLISGGWVEDKNGNGSPDYSMTASEGKNGWQQFCGDVIATAPSEISRTVWDTCTGMDNLGQEAGTYEEFQQKMLKVTSKVGTLPAS